MTPAPSEFDQPPTLMLVHDPAAEDAFAEMERAGDPRRVERAYLFRERPDAARYGVQHRAFVDLLRRHVPRVVYLRDLLAADPAFAALRREPNLAFTRDSVVTLPWRPDGFLRMRMREPLRRGECEVTARALAALGLREIAAVPEPYFLEGGDVVPFARHGRRVLLVGFGPRSSRPALDFLCDALVPWTCDEIIGIELEAWRMNLDGGLLPVASDVVVADRASIRGALLLDRAGVRPLDLWSLLADLGMEVIETTSDESIYMQSCNCACLGGRRVVYYDLCARVAGLLRRAGVEVETTAGSELVKGRAGPRCMTRPVYDSPALARGLARQFEPGRVDLVD